MLSRCLILSAVFCLTLSRHRKDDDASCGKLRRACGLNAYCVSGQCVCKDYFVGAPLVECIQPEKFQCALQADPHLVAYEKATANLPYPCKYRLTRIVTPLEGATPGVSYCSFEVFGYNEIVDGRYYTSGMEVSLAIGDFANQFFKQVDVIKFDVNKRGVQTSDGDATEWGTGVHSSWKNITVECKFDRKERFAILNVPRCDFRAKFRPFDDREPSGAQSHVPGISVVTGEDTRFGDIETGRYPASLCGENSAHGSDESLYINRQRFLRCETVDQTVLHDVLQQALVQAPVLSAATVHVLQDSDSCQATIDEFKKCEDLNATTEAITTCSPILTRRPVTTCLGIKVLDAFRACLKASCGERSACSTYKEVLSSNGCDGPRSVEAFCRKWEG